MGALAGITVVELAGIGPLPFCGMLLADHGADVVRVDRTRAAPFPPAPDGDMVGRNRASIAVDLKQPEGRDIVLRLVDSADVLLEGFRPGVTERLGLGPDDCHLRNPGLVYARLTGWGQDGPLAPTAGHDIDYIALAGALHPIGPSGTGPVPPLNYVADYGGGAVLMAFAICAALVERAASGRGQVIDLAMTEGAALLTTMFRGMLASGLWRDDRTANLLDGSAPFYRTYTTADGRFVAVGALEPQFYAELLSGLGLTGADLPAQYDPAGWPRLTERFAAVFRERTRDEWEAVFSGTDACVAPVLSLGEAADHPHHRAREAFRGSGAGAHPAPVPRFDRTPAPEPGAPVPPGADTDRVLARLGLGGAAIERLRAAGVIR